MKKLGRRLQGVQGLNGPMKFDLAEYDAAVDLHNIDRSHSFDKEIEASGYAVVCYRLLENSPFSGEAKGRIVQAAVEHGKKDDEPGDSDLAVALRCADKLDRFFPSAIVGCGTSHPHLFPYDESPHPFWGGSSTRENDLKTQYKMFFRPLEWYRMLPSDEVRALIKPRFLKLFIDFLRCLGEEASDYLGIENRAEDDLRTAFGKHYDSVIAIVGPPPA
jgi:hypothetical protein